MSPGVVTSRRGPPRTAPGIGVVVIADPDGNVGPLLDG